MIDKKYAADFCARAEKTSFTGARRRLEMKGSCVIVALCALAASPAMADLFGVSGSNLQTSYDGSSFTATDYAPTMINVYRNTDPAGFAVVLPGISVAGTPHFMISMDITDVTADEADASGWFTVKDVQGDILAGDINGYWERAGSRGQFGGSLSNVTYTSADTEFDGHFGSTSMDLDTSEPWKGFITGLTMDGAWFQNESFSVDGGDISMRVVHAPVPAALSLCLLGFGSAGLKLKRYL